ncbi:MAG: TlpA family protein disulfide reductase [Ignavibacteriae bacterium]|nr:TlpA family protein disulfide reductase [Ignavibacteriota bacterium]
MDLYAPREAIRIASVLPEFSFRSVEDSNQVLTNASFLGNHLLLVFWATWCTPCVAEMPALHEAYHKYRRAGLNILSVSLNNTHPRSAGLESCVGLCHGQWLRCPKKESLPCRLALTQAREHISWWIRLARFLSSAALGRCNSIPRLDISFTRTNSNGLISFRIITQRKRQPWSSSAVASPAAAPRRQDGGIYDPAPWKEQPGIDLHQFLCWLRLSPSPVGSQRRSRRAESSSRLRSSPHPLRGLAHSGRDGMSRDHQGAGPILCRRESP